MTGIVDGAAPREQPLKINVHAGSNKNWSQRGEMGWAKPRLVEGGIQKQKKGAKLNLTMKMSG